MPEINFPPIPQALPCFKTYVFKRVDHVLVEVDVYLPSVETDTSNRNVLLFIHGGAWIGGHRQEYYRPLFAEFLDRGFVIVLTDYQLLPESSLQYGQLQDIRDVGPWIRDEMPQKLEQDGGKRIQVGKLW